LYWLWKEDGRSVQLSYSWFWYGAFVNQNLPRDDARQLYVMTTLQY
jgi:hypothetical protein